jgi:hypothetical protein
MARKVQTGELIRESLVWRQGIGEWTVAEEVAELAKKFVATPPPLPKQ